MGYRVGKEISIDFDVEKWDIVAEKAKILLPNLKTLNGREYASGDVIIDRIIQNPQIFSADLRGAMLSESVLERLKEIPWLRELVVVSSRLKDENIQHLIPLIHLESLELKGDFLTDDSLKDLFLFEHLTTLEIKFPNLTKKGLRKQMPNGKNKDWDTTLLTYGKI